MKSVRCFVCVTRRPGLPFTWLAGLSVVFVAQTAFAADYYVATTGDDANPGTLDQPFATLQKGAKTAVAGDTVYIRGGTYRVTTPGSTSAGIVFSKSGTSDTNRIRYWAYEGEVPVFDFTDMKISTSGYTHGFSVTGSWLHFKGLEICNVPMNEFSNNGIAVDGGGNDIFELLDLHHINGTGIFIGKGSGGHLVLNCDSHDNYDPTSNQGEGQNADGFGVHYQTSGARTVLRGCRAWWNSDDGYDLINQEASVTVENSWAMGNGYAKYGTYSPSSGNGNGFKMGSSKTGVRHLVQNNVAWKNKASGFYANHSTGGNTWYNNTSYNNGAQFNMLASPADDPNTTIVLSGALAHIMRNNLGFPNKNTNMNGVDSASNAWDLSLTPASKDFASISDPSVSGTGASIESSGALGPREADGSMPRIDFLKLASGSQMIDKGVDVGLPFVGKAPDLGAYEFGATENEGGGQTGGSTTSGGAAGSSGSASGGTGGRSGAASGAGGAARAGGSAGAGVGGARARGAGGAATSGGAGDTQGASTGGRGPAGSVGGGANAPTSGGGGRVAGNAGNVGSAAGERAGDAAGSGVDGRSAGGTGGASGSTTGSVVNRGETANGALGGSAQAPETAAAGCSCALGGRARSTGTWLMLLGMVGMTRALRRRRGQ